VAVGRGNWTFFGTDVGGKTASVLCSFIASCQRVNVDPFAWFKDASGARRSVRSFPGQHTTGPLVYLFPEVVGKEERAGVCRVHGLAAGTKEHRRTEVETDTHSKR
jgi:hypothetical protein